MNHINSFEAGFQTALRRQRLESGISQIELARRTGIAQARIWLIEQGGARPGKQAAEKIAAVLGLEPEKVFPDFATFRNVYRVARAQA